MSSPSKPKGMAMMMALPKLALPESSLDPGQKLHYGIFSLVGGKMA